MRDDFYTIIQEAAMLGAVEAIKQMQPSGSGDCISQTQAYARFGRKLIESYEKEGRLNVVRNGSGKNSKKLYSVAEIVSLNASRNIERSIINIKHNSKCKARSSKRALNDNKS